MFIKIDRPFYGDVVLNSRYIVEIRATTKNLNGKEYKITVLTMHDGETHDAFETLPVILKRLAEAGGRG